jgi:hypothetical protein
MAARAKAQAERDTTTASEMTEAVAEIMLRVWALRVALVAAPKLAGKLTSEAMVQCARDIYDDLEEVQTLMTKAWSRPKKEAA